MSELTPFDKCYMEQKPSRKEEALYKLFVSEYIKDYNATEAALRIGFKITAAMEFGQRFLDNAYVHKLISEAETELFESTEPHHLRFKRARVESALMREAYKGRDPKARTAALATLAKIYRMEEPLPKHDEAHVRGGVIVVPDKLNHEDWEQMVQKHAEKNGIKLV